LTWEFLVVFAHTSRLKFLAVPREFSARWEGDSDATFPVDKTPNET
jgi:hypothetical protein